MAIIALVLVFNSKAQSVAKFDDLTLSPTSFWNGSNQSGSFASSGITFYNSYNPDWQSWSGFAYSNMTDVTTVGVGNQYSAITGKGNGGSSNYAVCYPVPSAIAEFKTATKVSGFYVTNSTYAYLSMKNGDQFSKKYGGETGNDPDYFKLMIEALNDAGEPIDTINFYLADFRSTDNSKDYILNKWTWVDLSALKETHKLRFTLSSSDNSFGYMNTPAYFCMDDLNGEFSSSSPEIHHVQASVYPNPFSDRIVISGIKSTAHVTVSDISGRTVREYLNISNNQSINGLDNLKLGVYIIKIIEGNNQITSKLVKK